MTAPRLRIREIVVGERPVILRLPFRFGVITLRQCSQAFVRTLVSIEGHGEVYGCAAEVIAPKWFDKSPEIDEIATLDQLRLSLQLAGSTYVTTRWTTAFRLFCTRYDNQIRECAAAGLPPLAAGYGQALIDRAVFDAVCRGSGLSFLAGLQRNLAGLSPEMTPDLCGFDLDGFLRDRTGLPEVAARHTIGMIDPLFASDQDPESRVADGLPETLEDVIEHYGMRYFKIKIGGDITADHDRLARIADCLNRIDDDFFVTIDGNEQYQDAESVLALMARLEEDPSLSMKRLLASTICLEQPIAREFSAGISVERIAARTPVMIDESDGTVDAFPQHRSLGYQGVSSKTCKGFYKSILNSARCRSWNDEDGGTPFFVSGEDLTCQAGIAVQQDLALVSALGITHVERNGHHYARGMSAASPDEQRRFLHGFPELYEWRDGVVCLRIKNGKISTRALNSSSGWASAVEPEWSAFAVTMHFSS